MNRAQRRRLASNRSKKTTNNVKQSPKVLLLNDARQHIKLEQWEEAQQALTKYIDKYPSEPIGYSLLGKVHSSQRRFKSALEQYSKAYALSQNKEVHLYEIAGCLRKQRLYTQSIKLYREILEEFPEHYKANIGLSIALRYSGDLEGAARHGKRAIELNPVFIPRRATGRNLNVMALKTHGNLFYRERKSGYAIEGGHNTADGLIPDRMGRATVYVDNFEPDAPWLDPIKNWDVALNVISDPDLVDPHMLDQAARLIDWLNIPVLNHPKALQNSTRDGVFNAIRDIEHLVMPRTIRFVLEAGESLVSKLEQFELSLPIIIRPIGTQTGEGMCLYRTVDDFKDQEPAVNDQEYYAVEFFDFRSDDGYYRKTRMFCIGEEILAEHHVAAEHWNIHAKNARILMSRQQFIDEEIDFITNHQEYLGEGRMSALKQMAHNIGLDYFGVDCSLLPDGRLLIFEANPSMQFKSSSQNERAFLLQNRSNISEAFARCIENAAGIHSRIPS